MLTIARPLVALSSIVLIASTAMACGGAVASSPDDAGAPPGQTLDAGTSTLTEAEFVDRYAHAICDHIGPCCSGDVPFDHEKCLVSLRPLNESFTHFNPDGAARCLDRVTREAATCGPDVTSGSIFDNSPCFQDAYVGTGALGDVCEQAGCAGSPEGSVLCNFTSDGGHCTLLRPPHVGDPCPAVPTPLSTVVDEVAPYRCDPTTNRLVPLASLGGLCRNSADCEDGLRCQNGACAVGASAGESCIRDVCATGSYCDRAIDKCAPRKPIGSACVDHRECASDACAQFGESYRCASTEIADGYACGISAP